MIGSLSKPTEKLNNRDYDWLEGVGPRLSYSFFQSLVFTRDASSRDSCQVKTNHNAKHKHAMQRQRFNSSMFSLTRRRCYWKLERVLFTHFKSLFHWTNTTACVTSGFTQRKRTQAKAQAQGKRISTTKNGEKLLG